MFYLLKKFASYPLQKKPSIPQSDRFDNGSLDIGQWFTVCVQQEALLTIGQ